MSLEKYKWKQNHSNMYPQEWPKSRTLTWEMLMTMWSDRNSHSFVGGNWIHNGTFVGRNFGSFLQIKLYLMCDTEITIVSIYSERFQTYFYTTACTQIFITSKFIVTIPGSSKHVVHYVI